jgi:hypothetical protein
MASGESNGNEKTLEIVKQLVGVVVAMVHMEILMMMKPI